ncbi:hypothetical protein HanHA300_Chr16g0603121 [Helianthus annuus]|nr:hypothetical protein HanHA300_Chr16g0603121 [Helianthus annuus]KAJ0441992.1 hypothetical protein HanIR_Chr16g0804081 [Helianthus annuus]KAJ0459842.1 hypothetical protein HanHA89_Chr16g0653651 [Helianthus annuus]KAJ0640309.1 hypothetical protein HanLR1_Chr16g0613931 [Helianthus annuus]
MLQKNWLLKIRHLYITLAEGKQPYTNLLKRNAHEAKDVLAHPLPHKRSVSLRDSEQFEREK